jgi:hypothetical protein
MYNALLENQLISPDIANLMQDYTSMQIDIDNAKVKAAALVAQRIDLTRLIGAANVLRCVGITEASDPADIALYELVVAPWCYFTYSRCLKMFQGTFTDSGYTTEVEAEARGVATSVSNEMKGIAETFMIAVIEFLDLETPNTPIDSTKLTPRIRVFGGEENRGSN